ncbi:MAG: hypothetical protein KDA87_02445, partial [Planctomycetales bacterium]|nr:hypothetical protein [Planctomycetales bacterium]
TVNLTTYTLKYNRMHWLTVDHLQQHWEAAHVTATIGNQMVDIRANNVTQLSLAFDSGQWPGRMDDQVTIRINGQRVTSVKPRSDLSLRVTLHQTADQWRAGSLPDGGLRKRHNLQGPIDDALMDSFIFVRPTGKAANKSVAAWANQEMERAIEHWRRHFRGDVRIKNDVDITDDDIANANLILWGETANNSVMQRVAEQLPIQWDHSAITVGSKKYSSQQHGLIAIYPNPLNPDRYVVLNSSFTFRDFAYLNNARQVPKLPDWAIVDIRTAPDSLWPGKIVDANFFGEQWELIESNLPDPHITMSALRSFWTSQTVTESLFFIQEEDYLPPQARLFYRPQQVLKLTDAARQTEFIEGQDYEVDLDAGVVRLTKESRIPFKTYDQLYPLLESDSPKIPSARHDEKRGIFWGEGSLYHGLQTEVTYQKAAQQPLDSQWSANEVPTFDPTALPRTLQKLRQQQPLRIHLMGDSISEGYNASGFTGAKPHQPPYGQLVADALAHTYNVRINFQNFARAGWVSAQGVSQVQRERVAVDQPDLVIIAFGMNDVGQKNPAAYQNHLRQVIQQVRQTSPDTEFILVSSMLGNAAWQLPMEMFDPLNEKLHELGEPGIAVVDMTNIWHRLLRRKTFYDLTGNGVNHPNDFGHRLYAQAILTKLIDPVNPSQTSDAHPLDSLTKAKRIVFLGDSITYAGDYIGFWETWLAANVVSSYPEIINVGLPSETVSGLSEDGHAGGKFPRPHLAERLDRVLAATKPDVVVACYGMNCGIYLPLDQDRFQKYQDGMLQLKEKVEAAGAKLIVITPPTFDDAIANKDFSYDAVLAEYAHWLVSKRSDGWTVIDFHNRMLDQLAANRLQDAEFTFQPDAVHPNRSGHWFVAQQLIRWCGDRLPDAVDTSPEAMLDRLGVSPELLDLIRQRQMVRRDAYLTAAGHLRPGIANGLPVAEAEAEAAKLTRKIEALRTTTSP